MKNIGYDWTQTPASAGATYDKDNLVAKCGVLPALMREDVFNFTYARDAVESFGEIAKSFLALGNEITSIVKGTPVQKRPQKIYYAVNEFRKKYTEEEYLIFYKKLVLMSLNTQDKNIVVCTLLHVLISDFYGTGVIMHIDGDFKRFSIYGKDHSLLDYLLLILCKQLQFGSNTKLPMHMIANSVFTYIEAHYSVDVPKLLAAYSTRLIDDFIVTKMPKLFAIATYLLFPIGMSKYKVLATYIPAPDEYDSMELFSLDYLCHTLLPKDILTHRDKVLAENGVTLRNIKVDDNVFNYIYLKEVDYEDTRLIQVYAYDSKSEQVRALMLDIQNFDKYLPLSAFCIVDYHIILRVLVFYGLLSYIHDYIDNMDMSVFAKELADVIPEDEIESGFKKAQADLQQYALNLESYMAEDNVACEVPFSWQQQDTSHGSKSNSIVTTLDTYTCAIKKKRNFSLLFKKKRIVAPDKYFVTIDGGEVLLQP